MLKRWSAALLAVVLMVSLFGTFFAVSAEDTPKLALKISSEMIPGSQVTVEVQLENNPGTTGLVLDLEYSDAVLTLTDAQPGAIADESAYVVWDKTTPHKVAFGSGIEAKGDGTIVVLTFLVKADAAPGSYTFGVSTADATNAAVGQFSVEAAAGNFKILDYVWGDATGDKVTNVADAQQILKHRVGKGVTLNEKAADADRDGEVTLADAILILQWQAKLVDWDHFGETTPPLNMA